nr:MAG TPA: hypothetical protein [Herelleviridae sp.]
MGSSLLTGEEEITQKNLIIDEAIEKEFKE